MIERAIMANITQASLEGDIDQIDRARQLLNLVKGESFIDYEKVFLSNEQVIFPLDQSSSISSVEPIAIFNVPETLEVLREKAKVREKLNSEIEDKVLRGRVISGLDRIAREFKISRPEDISRLSDQQLMRVRNVGPSLISVLREIYPVDLS